MHACVNSTPEFRFVLGRERCSTSYKKDIRSRRAYGNGAGTRSASSMRVEFEDDLPRQELDEIKKTVNKNENVVISTICVVCAHVFISKSGVTRMHCSIKA